MTDELSVSPGSWTYARVGAVLICAIAILLVIVYLLTGGSELFAPKITLHTYMNDVSGLEKDATVRLNGIVIGKIKAVSLTKFRDPKRATVVEMAVKNRFLAALPEDSVAGVSADNLLGGKYINITEGRSSRTVQPGGVLPSANQQDLFNQADLVDTLRSNLNRVDAILVEIESGKTETGRFVYTDQFYESIRSRIADVQDAISKYGSPSSPFGKAMYRKDAYVALRRPFVELDKTLAAIQSGEGTAGQLLTNPAKYDEARQDVAELRKSISNFSKSPMLRSDESYVRVQKMLKSVDEAIGGLNAGEGQFGQLLTNPQLYDSLNGATREMRSFLSELRQDPRKFLRVKVF